jgi:hypothetical protein
MVDRRKTILLAEIKLMAGRKKHGISFNTFFL